MLFNYLSFQNIIVFLHLRKILETIVNCYLVGSLKLYFTPYHLGKNIFEKDLTQVNTFKYFSIFSDNNKNF